jgi:hypothetical protein
MLDWGARSDDVAFFVATQYRMEDRQALEILLSALIPCPRTPALWLVLETNYYRRSCESAWFSLGASWPVCSLGEIRSRRPHRDVKREITAWLEDSLDIPRLFIEPDFDRRREQVGISPSRRSQDLACRLG